MKKLLYILFAISLSVSFVACGGDEDEKTTDPLRGDDKTTEEIVGKYEKWGGIVFDNGDIGINDMKIINFIFRDDFIVEEAKKLEGKYESKWYFNNRVLYFNTSIYGEVQAWFEGNILKFRVRVPSYSNNIGTFSFQKTEQNQPED